MENFSIYLTGVGGQGIGLLSEILIRAADHAGHPVKGVDTHGLAQRGGIVISHIRLGQGIHTPLVPAGKADLVVALERHEALRGGGEVLRDGGILVYYDTVWQPLEVRLGAAAQVTRKAILEMCEKRRIREIAVLKEDLSDSRMQNIVLLATLAREALIPAIKMEHYEQGMEDLMSGPMLDANRDLFRMEAGLQ